MSEFKTLVQELKPFCKKLTGKTADKAITDLARNLASALCESGISSEKYLHAYENDLIFNPDCLLANQPNIFKFVSADFEEFCQVMFDLRPVGLGTPNAMVGEGEFMAIFSSPRVGISKKKNCGDITVDGKTIEMKGAELRIMGKTTGKQVQAHAIAIAKKYGVAPNQTKDGKRTAFEPWDTSDSVGKASHWIKQFDVLGVDKSCEYLADLCGAFISCKKEDFSVCFVEEKFKATRLLNVILKKLFDAMEKEWDAFTVIDNGKVSCLSKDAAQFSTLIDEGKVVVTTNYFRSFQDTNVGLYIKLV